MNLMEAETDVRMKQELSDAVLKETVKTRDTLFTGSHR